MNGTLPIDIVATWPKSRPLESYLSELRLAGEHGLVINYRVARPPRWQVGALSQRRARCYMVHDGFVRGWNEILFVTQREEGEVRGERWWPARWWPAGWYIVRDPLWYSLGDDLTKLPAMRGFQGWRWYEP